MSMNTAPQPNRPLLDPQVLEQAGRNFRAWIERLLLRFRIERDTSIAWETGEPDDDDKRPPAY
jgi:hypothetical protein